MLDKNLKPYLIEINTNPGLHMLTDIVIPHHTKAQRDLLKGFLSILFAKSKLSLITEICGNLIM